MTTKSTAVMFQALVVVAVCILVATQAAADPPLPMIPAASFNITSYGAVGDGVTDNAGAIQSAINAAGSAGGGTVIVAAVGISTNYLSGPINLTNNVCLEIDAGTQLQMLPMASWPSPGTPFITSINQHDVAINGTGTIDGNAGFNVGPTLGWWGPPPPANSPVASRPDFIHFGACTNILIQGVTLQNPPTFHIMIKGENVNLTIQNITEATPGNSPNTDGMDVGSSNVLVRNCSISVGDDNIEIGGSLDPVANMTVSNCFFGTGHGVSLGSFVNGNGEGVHDLIVSNCAFSGTDNGIRMKSDVGRGGPVHDLVYRDITINNVKYPFVIYSYYNEVGTPSAITPFLASVGTGTVETVATPTTPAWRNITFSNITVVASNGFIAGIIWGRPDSLVSNVTFQDVTITATKSFCIYNAQGIQFINSRLNIPGTTNSINVYNADVTITNAAAVTNLVTIGGLAIPPTNNALSFFNATAAITDTNELGTAPITLSGSTLTLSRTPAVISNNLNIISSSVFNFTSGQNTYSGTFNGPVALNQSAGVLQFFGNGTFAGGPPATLANLTVGDCGQAISGSIVLNGSTLYVTNGTQTGVLDIRDGTFTLNSGVLVVDKLVITNACGHFVRLGGSVIATTIVLDPSLDADGDGIPNGYEQAHALDPLSPADATADNDGDGFSNLQEFLAGTDPNDSSSTPFRITSIVQQGTDIILTWNTLGGRTNVVQVAGGASYGGTNFTALSAPIAILGSGMVTTNYIDHGGATNTPPRFYRIKMMSSPSADDASDLAYSGVWTNGSNGGVGFNPWILTATGVIGSSSNGFFVASSINNAFNTGPTIDVGGNSWGIYANGGNLTAAYRTFTNGSLAVGSSLLISLDNGFIDSGNTDGFVLRNGTATSSPSDYNVGARFEFFYLGGDSSNSYKVVDAGGQKNIGVPFTGTGLRLVFTLTGANTYNLLTMDNASGATNTFSGTLEGSGTVDSLAVYNRNAGGGTTANCFFNSLQIVSP